MDTKDLKGLMEAYSEVYSPEQLDEISQKTATRAYAASSTGEFEGQDSPRDVKRTDNLRRQIKRKFGDKAAQHADRAAHAMTFGRNSKFVKMPKKPTNEELDIFDVVLEFLQAEGFAETLEEAEWLMANMIDEEAIGIILGEAIYSEKGKAKAAEMIAKRSTPSGRAKPGKGANVAQIRQIRGSGRGRFDREGLGGTPMTPTMAKNPIKKQNYDGTGNKAARRAAALKKEDFELWVNGLVEEGYDLSDYTWDEMYDIYEAEKPFPYEKVKKKQVSLRDKGGNALDRRMQMGAAVRRAKEAEKTGGSQRDAGKGWYHAKEDYVNEAQHARENPEKYEREQSKKSAPVRGERTPMPPRGDKRREDFEKWYAKQMGR